MTHGGLFSGLGSAELAAEECGIINEWSCEIDPYCQAVLRKNFGQNHLIYGDIKEVRKPKPVDIVTGGFPCQPVSRAGKRRGKEDERWLWPEMLRVYKESGARWLVPENVDGLADMELEGVCIDMEDAGLEVQPFSISAASLGLPTLERHWWLIASPAGASGIEGFSTFALPYIEELSGQLQRGNTRIGSGRYISESRFCGVAERVSAKLDKAGRQRLNALGNSFPPIMPYIIFQYILKIESKL